MSIAHIGQFKPLTDFDWQRPSQCDKGAISDFIMLGFFNSSVFLPSLNGIGASPPCYKASPILRSCMETACSTSTQHGCSSATKRLDPDRA